MKCEINWTDDCQGKKDYDGDIVCISTRFWPGPLTVFDSAHPEKGLHEIPGGEPSAVCHVLLRDGAPDGESLELIGKEFEGATFEAVASKVERWSQKQMHRVVKAMMAEFKETVETRRN